MTKAVIINDSHCGVRNSAEVFIDYQDKFYNTVLFPYMKKHGISRIIHAGDYAENRKFLNIKSTMANRKHFLEPLRQFGWEMDVIPGNHDVAYKNTNELCSLDIIFDGYGDCVRLHHEPTELFLGGKSVCLIPWINTENYASIMNFVAATSAPICIGHFEFSGFEMSAGVVSQHGMSTEPFNKFDTVLSGHFHTKSTVGNVTYLGSQFEFTWADVDDPKYFHVLDTDTGEIEAVLNPLTMFSKIVYNDVIYDYDNFDFTILDNKFVKVVVERKNDPYIFDKFIDSIQARSIHDLKIADMVEAYSPEDFDDEFVFQGTSELLNAYVDGCDTSLDKERLKTALHRLYVEASNREYQ